MPETNRGCAAVDRLPSALWNSGYLIFAPGGDLHFCTAPCDDVDSVRTVEWNGREVLRGNRPIDHRRPKHTVAIIDLDGRAARVVAGVFVCILLLMLQRRRRR